MSTSTSIRSSFLSFGRIAENTLSLIGDDADGVPVTAKLLPLKNVTKSRLLKVAVRASEEIKSFTVFESEILLALADFKWESRIKRQFMRHLIMECFMVGLFTTDALLHTKTENMYVIKFDGTDTDKLFLMAPGILILIPWMFFVNHEFHQFMTGKVGLRSHVFSNILNFMDFSSLTLIIITFLSECLNG